MEGACFSLGKERDHYVTRKASGGGPHPLLHQKPEWVSVLSVQPNFTNDLSAQALPFSPGKGYEQRSHEKQVLL